MSCKREGFELVKMQELLEKTGGNFEGFSRKIYEKVNGLRLNTFNRGERLGVIKSLLGFPSYMNEALHVIDTCEKVRSI